MHIEYHYGDSVLIFFTRGIQSLYFRRGGKSRKGVHLDNKHECCCEQSALDTMRLITGMTGLSFKLIQEEGKMKTYKLV